jgi:hypothetical protein
VKRERKGDIQVSGPVLRLYTVPDAKLLGAVESVGEVGVLTFCDQCRFTPDGRHVAIIKKEVMELRSIKDAETVAKVCLAEKKEMTPVQLTFSADGSTAAMLIREAPGICVWSMPKLGKGN